MLAQDLPRLLDPPPAPGVRLIAPGDPLLLGRDREALAPDPDLRARIWRATGGAGIVLVDGAPAAVWSARRAGRVLRAAVEPVAPLPRDAVAEAFARLAPHRGCDSAAVEVEPEGRPRPRRRGGAGQVGGRHGAGAQAAAPTSPSSASRAIVS